MSRNTINDCCGRDCPDRTQDCHGKCTKYAAEVLMSQLIYAERKRAGEVGDGLRARSNMLMDRKNKKRRKR